MWKRWICKENFNIEAGYDLCIIESSQMITPFDPSGLNFYVSKILQVLKNVGPNYYYLVSCDISFTVTFVVHIRGVAIK